jgi:hypothetical protein
MLQEVWNDRQQFVSTAMLVGNLTSNKYSKGAHQDLQIFYGTGYSVPEILVPLRMLESKIGIMIDTFYSSSKQSMLLIFVLVSNLPLRLAQLLTLIHVLPKITKICLCLCLVGTWRK